MSKITNDGLTRSSTERFTAVTIWQQLAPLKQVNKPAYCGKTTINKRQQTLMTITLTFF